MCWTALDRDQARSEWAALAGWVDWLVDRYGLAERVPGCWYRHLPLLEELSALRCAWLGAYESPTARPTDGVYWHGELCQRKLSTADEPRRISPTAISLSGSGAALRSFMSSAARTLTLPLRAVIFAALCLQAEPQDPSGDNCNAPDPCAALADLHLSVALSNALGRQILDSGRHPILV